MSWTLQRYIGGRFLGMALSAFGVVFALIAILNAIELLRRNSQGQAEFGQILSMALLQSPAIALTALPFVAMLAALAAFARLARGSELVVIRAAGVSAWTVVAAPLALAALLGVLATAVLNPLAAATSERYLTLEARYLKGQASRLSVSREGLWLRDGGPEGQMVIHARGANGSATRLSGVTIHLFAEEDTLTGRIDAARATLGDGRWTLQDGVRRDLRHEAGAPEADPLAAAAPAPFETLTIPTALTSAQILDSFAPPEQVSFWALPGFIRTLEASGFSAQRHRTHWHGQLAAPLLFAAMALIGAAFSMRPARLGGLGGMALAAAISGLGLYFLSDLAKALAASGAIPAALGAWGPPAAAALFAAGLLLQLEDG